MLSVCIRSGCLEQALIYHCCYNHLQVTVPSLSFSTSPCFFHFIHSEQTHSAARIIANNWEIS